MRRPFLAFVMAAALAAPVAGPRGAEGFTLTVSVQVLEAIASAGILAIRQADQSVKLAETARRDPGVSPGEFAVLLKRWESHLAAAGEGLQRAEGEIRKIGTLCLKTLREWRGEQKKLPAADPKRKAIQQDVLKFDGACKEAKAKIEKERRSAKAQLGKAQQRVQALKKGPVKKP
ncbi:MAG: hypothetical protein HYU38_10680 [Candidatus Tectomicrobia bacterium]|nr:hypothetical protein [Candidatus Tectomicrobia bacterium]